MKHYSEADLLETYYMQPDQTTAVMLHLAACEECSARFNRLEEKMRAAAAAGCPTDKPETFWSRQRIAVMRRIGERPSRTARVLPAIRFAAAVLLAFVLGGAVTYRHMAGRIPPAVAQQAPLAATDTGQTQQQTVEPQGRIDPWESEQLRDFHAMVEWESWVPETQQVKGDDAL